MTTPVLVVGHKNPDNDSISAAVSYANLKNLLETRKAAQTGEPLQYEYIPARLGPCPAESAWVLENNGFEQPKLISHINPRACDIMTPAPITISHSASIIEAGHLIRAHKVRNIVVNDDNGKFFGLFTRRALSQLFIAATDLLEKGGTQAVVNRLNEAPNGTVDDIVDKDVLVVDPEAVVSSFADQLEQTELRCAVVLNDKGACIGIITRTDLMKTVARKLILVDHNEINQAVDGIQNAEVMEIIDHHRIADVSTANPILFLNKPWGSTATIITTEYKQNDVEITKEIAAVLLSAILTDTVIMKSPTTTDIDRENVYFLASLIGVDPVEYGISLFKQRQGKEEIPVEKLVGADAKEFKVGDKTVLIAQHETVDLQGALNREDEIRSHMDELLMSHGYDFVLLLVTDIIAEGSQFICQGNRDFINKVFDIECNGKGGTWMPGVLSRKKQVAAKILA